MAGAYVGVNGWRGMQLLDWRTETDSEGRFVWDSAPADRVVVGAGKLGYSSVDNVTINPSDDKDIVITLNRGGALRIKGTVVDQQTGKPISSFRIIPAVMGGNEIWLLDQAINGRDGRFQFGPTLGNEQHLFRIEAEGYLPVVSPVYSRNGGERVFDARLTKGPWLEGTVKNTAGKPLKGAEVILVTGYGISIGGGSSYQRENHPHQITGVDGRFSLSPPIGDSRLRGASRAGLRRGDQEAVRLPP